VRKNKRSVALRRAHNEHDRRTAQPNDYEPAYCSVNSVSGLLWNLCPSFEQHGYELRKPGGGGEPKAGGCCHRRPEVLCKIECGRDPSCECDLKSHQELGAPAAKARAALVLGNGVRNFTFRIAAEPFAETPRVFITFIARQLIDSCKRAGSELGGLPACHGASLGLSDNREFPLVSHGIALNSLQ
jgi:hypothetical protein